MVSTPAAEFGFQGVTVADDGESQSYYVGSTWMVLSRDPSLFTNPILIEGSPEEAKVKAAGWEVAFDGMEVCP